MSPSSRDWDKALRAMRKIYLTYKHCPDQRVVTKIKHCGRVVREMGKMERMR